ncbi:MAG: GHMP kinase [Acidobacteria bacterium]|nr:MAG: GHMP kinase [Acidobacteriota bacterium]
MPERVETRAPTRIDLAGGTIDLWPLYLLHDEPVTVNAAIDQYARALIETTSHAGIELVSADRDRRARFASVAELRAALPTAQSELEFPMRLAAHFLGKDRGGSPSSCRISTDCQAPAGSGLGGSSALGIALAKALDRYTERRLDDAALLSLTRSIETQVLRIPTGEQDYHPALGGGILALHYTVEGTRVERLAADPETLRDRTVLVFTGVSRSSGLSNWDMLKRHLDGDQTVRAALDRIIGATRAMRRALLAADWDAAGEALGEEWEARKRMSPMVSNETIDRLIDTARSAGAVAGKVCGAGGGGCVVLWSRAGRRQAVADSAARLGARILDFRYVAEGVLQTES